MGRPFFMSQPIPIKSDIYQQLFRNGSLVHVRISRWTMAAELRNSDLFDDLATAPALPDFAVLGHKYLLPQKQRRRFTVLESRSRQLLRDNSFAFPIGHLHFVAHQRLPKVLARLNECRDAYLKEVADFLEEYPRLQQEMLEKYPEHRTKLEPYYPAAERLRERFGFTVSLVELALPRRLRELDPARIQARLDAQSGLEREFRQSLQGQYDESLQQVRQFVQEAVAGSRRRIVETFETVGRRLRDGQVPTSAALDRIREFISSFREISFVDDRLIQDRLAEVSDLVLQQGDRPDTDPARLSAAVNRLLDEAGHVMNAGQVTDDYLRRLNLDEPPSSNHDVQS